ncbi:MAG TPA: hypothetical protein ENI60_03110 [Candidatus Fraserbacteria bacterium]|nr:hypothetical protein [Candidatus Fraserbacteria bacterium]
MNKIVLVGVLLVLAVAAWMVLRPKPPPPLPGSTTKPPISKHEQGSSSCQQARGKTQLPVRITAGGEGQPICEIWTKLQHDKPALGKIESWVSPLVSSLIARHKIKPDSGFQAFIVGLVTRCLGSSKDAAICQEPWGYTRYPVTLYDRSQATTEQISSFKAALEKAFKGKKQALGLSKSQLKDAVSAAVNLSLGGVSCPANICTFAEIFPALKVLDPKRQQQVMADALETAHRQARGHWEELEKRIYVMVKLTPGGATPAKPLKSFDGKQP